MIKTKEEDLVDKIGLDATIFLRFTRMLRNLFSILSVIGILINVPVNVAMSDNSLKQRVNTFALLTPQFIFGKAWWSHVVCSWAFDLILVYFLWHNYRKVRSLRRAYFESSDYQQSLHARTVMVTDLPASRRSDEGILRVTDEVNPTGLLPRASIGRNVKDLPRLLEKHEAVVRRLEVVLSKYLKTPHDLPAQRPTLRPPRKFRGDRARGRVDAIDFLANKISELEQQIQDVRERIDMRNAKSFGFASWERIETAHAVAFSARRKHPYGTNIVLAPRPSDLIWENLPLSKAARRTKKLSNLAWVILLTVLWIPINACIAIFLADLSNLGRVWPAFQQSLSSNSGTWAVVQGIASPAITSVVYLVLPIIFRRLSIRAGDITKTSRERHVIHHLYAFFCFNNLVVFSLFSAVWAFISATIDATKGGNNAWDAIQEGRLYENILLSLCTVSPFWVMWLLQRNLGAAVDLAQIFNLFSVWFARTFLSPTPRQNVEWTAPRPFDYASYYNYFLFYATVALCFATLQPIVLPVTALYFALDSWLKKYLLMYVFVTKTESGGQMWRMLFNRMIFAAIFSNLIIGVVVKARGTWLMVGVMAPLPLMMLAFKFYCVKKFDNDIRFYVRTDMRDAETSMGGSKARRVEKRTMTKFSHPALYRPLTTPMVHARARQVLDQIYRGRQDLGGKGLGSSCSSIALQPMSTEETGRPIPSSWQNVAPLQMVPEGHQDFDHFKYHADFRYEFSGGIYGRPEDLISERSQSPRSLLLDQDETHGQRHGHGWTADAGPGRENSVSPAASRLRLGARASSTSSIHSNGSFAAGDRNRNSNASHISIVEAVPNEGILTPIPIRHSPLAGRQANVPLILQDDGPSLTSSPQPSFPPSPFYPDQQHQPSNHIRHTSSRGGNFGGVFEGLSPQDPWHSGSSGGFYANPNANESETRLLRPASERTAGSGEIDGVDRTSAH